MFWIAVETAHMNQIVAYLSLNAGGVAQTVWNGNLFNLNGKGGGGRWGEGEGSKAAQLCGSADKQQPKLLPSSTRDKFSHDKSKTTVLV